MISTILQTSYIAVKDTYLFVPLLNSLPYFDLESNLPDEAKNRLYKKLSGILKHQYGEDIILLSLTVVDDTADVENDHLVTEFLMQFLDGELFFENHDLKLHL